MKPSRRTRRHLGLLLTFVVFAHFGLGYRDVPALVLCFGSDGHVAVEPMHSPHAPAEQAAVAAHAMDTGAQAETASEGPCTDFPVIGEDHGAHKPAVGSERSSPNARLSVAPALVVSLIRFDEMVDKVALSPAHSLVDSRLSGRRSVVLLI
ncbi:MAG: hypothetical protein ACREXW_08075 [Gammaproteobacteria bacterium]